MESDWNLQGVAVAEETHAVIHEVTCRSLGITGLACKISAPQTTRGKGWCVMLEPGRPQVLR